MECLECGKEFNLPYKNAKFCNQLCRIKNSNFRWRVKCAKEKGKEIKHRQDKNCECCQKKMKNCLPHKKYCSPSCEKKSKSVQFERNIPKDKSININSSVTGAMNELIVCSDLLRRGHSVFRSVSNACSCDIIILIDKNIKRIEVTTGTMFSNNKFSIPKKDRSKFDILAIVFRNGEILYEPEI